MSSLLCPPSSMGRWRCEWLVIVVEKMNGELTHLVLFLLLRKQGCARRRRLGCGDLAASALRPSPHGRAPSRGGRRGGRRRTTTPTCRLSSLEMAMRLRRRWRRSGETARPPSLLSPFLPLPRQRRHSVSACCSAFSYSLLRSTHLIFVVSFLGGGGGSGFSPLATLAAPPGWRRR